jgi:hypothetical protein
LFYDDFECSPDESREFETGELLEAGYVGRFAI